MPTVLLCVYWGDETVPSVPQTCCGCAAQVAVSEEGCQVLTINPATHVMCIMCVSIMVGGVDA